MNNRFEVVKMEDLGSAGGWDVSAYILRDKKTGVLYLHNRIGGGVNITGGITPLLDEDGKPIVSFVCVECGFELTKDMKTCPECGCPIEN